VKHQCFRTWSSVTNEYEMSTGKQAAPQPSALSTSRQQGKHGVHQGEKTWSLTCWCAYTNHNRKNKDRKATASWVWWYIPVIPALRRWRQKDWEFEDSLDYTVRSCPNKARPEGLLKTRKQF
jgi:hypothetical protein